MHGCGACFFKRAEMRAGLAQHDENAPGGHLKRGERFGEAQRRVRPAGVPSSHPGDVVDTVYDNGDRALGFALDGADDAVCEGVFVGG